MKSAKYLDEEIVIKRGLEALVKELGPIEAMRFINIPKEKRLESVKRHRKWQRLLDKDKFFDEIFKHEVKIS
ncbi:MAG: hypothetical protein HS132_00125 [Planctomycetia bacterium]|nr:hypothetical protein [Planctomycetia bacterium]